VGTSSGRVIWRTNAWYQGTPTLHRQVAHSIQDFDNAGPYPLGFPYGLIMRALPKDMNQRILSLSGAALMQKPRGV
jgi:hypothetical protein